MSEQITSISTPQAEPSGPLADVVIAADVEPTPESAPPAGPRRPIGGVSLFGGIDPSAVKLKSAKSTGAAAGVARALPRPGTPPVTVAAQSSSSSAGSPEKAPEGQTSPRKTLQVTAEDTDAAGRLVSSIMAALSTFTGESARSRMLSLAQGIASEFHVNLALLPTSQDAHKLEIQIQQEHAEHRARVQVLEAELEKRDKTINELRSSVSDFSADSVRVSELEAELAASKSEAAILRSELSSAAGRSASDSNTTTARLAELEADLAASKAALAQRETEFAKSNSSADALIIESAGKIAKLEAELSASKSAAAQLTEDLSSTSSKLDVAEQESSDASIQIATLQAELVAVKAAASELETVLSRQADEAAASGDATTSELLHLRAQLEQERAHASEERRRLLENTEKLNKDEEDGLNRFAVSCIFSPTYSLTPI